MTPALLPYAKPVRRAAMLLAALLAVLIGYFSLVPAGETPAPQISDKIRHFAAYAALALPVCVWFGPGRMAAAAALVAVYGAGVELAQAALPTGREASVADALANALGAGAGMRAVWTMARLRRAR